MGGGGDAVPLLTCSLLNKHPMTVFVYPYKDPRSIKRQQALTGGQQLIPDDELYADPNSIEHEQAPTGDEYAMVDVASKKKAEYQVWSMEGAC